MVLPKVALESWTSAQVTNSVGLLFRPQEVLRAVERNVTNCPKAPVSARVVIVEVDPA